MADCAEYIHHCLYFTANSLARVVTRMAERAFRVTGLSPSHAFLVMLVNESPGITQKALAGHLHLAPSTVTRFVDTLAHRGIVARQTDGKATRVYPTDKAGELAEPIAAAWKNLYHQYSEILGEAQGERLTGQIDGAAAALEARGE